MSIFVKASKSKTPTIFLLMNKNHNKCNSNNQFKYLHVYASLIRSSYSNVLFNQKNEKLYDNTNFRILTAKLEFSTNNAVLNQQESQRLTTITGKKVFNYTFFVLASTAVGVLTGYWLMQDKSTVEDANESPRSNLPFETTKFVEHTDSIYHNLPLTIHVYQYTSCPYCTQLRAYLDYFGFSYYVTEVDSYTKYELTKFTKARTLPIVVIHDNINKKRWHFANATTVLSALESLRNDKKANYTNLLNSYLPILKGNSLNYATNANKYVVLNSDLNSIEWRKWINNTAMPAFKLNAICTLKDLFELFDVYATKSCWKQRYSTVKYYYVYYTDALKTYRQYPDLLNQLNSKKNPREILHDTIQQWEEGLNGKKFISQKNKPNLADLAMYGNVKAYEGCSLYREAIAKHSKFRKWFEDMEKEVIKGYKEEKYRLSISQYLQSFDENEQADLKSSNLTLTTSPPTELLQEDKTIKQTQSTSTQTQQNHLKEELKSINPMEKNIFRILAINYIVNVIAFSYASYMSK